MNPLNAWRLPLRLARRDALRHRGRSVLVLVMIALPVLAVTAADVLIQTSTVSGVESVDRRMGSAQALVTVTDGIGVVQQAPDPDDGLPRSPATATRAAPPPSRSRRCSTAPRCSSCGADEADGHDRRRARRRSR